MKKKKIDLARAWRDENYYLSLTEEERAGLGAHPAGAISDPILRSISGGCGGTHTYDCEGEYTVNTTGVCSVCPPEWCQ
jgi:mersacidin/lichenicidin family type 2 lantibiotic